VGEEKAVNEAFLSIDSKVAGKVKLAAVSGQPVKVQPSAGGLLEEMTGLAAELRRRFAGRTPAEIPELMPARRLYHAFGLDPTRTRPSSEALLRRILKGDELPRINNAVDVCNLLALKFWLSLGLYDFDKIQPPITLRAGGPDDVYQGIRKGFIRLEGRPALYDRQGPFGNPSSDSLRAAVIENTRALLLVIFAPGDYPDDKMAEHVETTKYYFRHLLGADKVRRF
jgi:DNA/RNA-binding domain of Phe-tRNA-synthetase-like protein